MNNNENKNDLNAISLGGVENSDSTNLNVPINDIPPVEPLESLDDVLNMEEATPENIPPVEQVASVDPVAPIEPLNDINAIPPVDPVAPVSYDIPESINDFSTTPIFNEIGTVPPIASAPVPEPIIPGANKNKKKTGISKTLFVLIVVLAITAVGVGVYIILNMANKKPPVITRRLNIEIGSEISSNINDYATFKGVDSSTCSLDTTNIKDTTTLNAEYSYKIICNEATYTGMVKIVDTVKPEVTLKEVTVGVNTEVKPEHFIELCTDKTKCSYKFSDEEKVKGYLKEAASYHVDIIVKDEAQNETKVTATLIVSDTVASIYLICSKEDNDVIEENKLGLVESQFNKTATRTYTFKFASKDDYKAFKNENVNKSEITYKNVTGKPVFKDSDNTVEIVKILSYADLNKEANMELPLAFGELKSYYEAKGFNCTIGY